MQEFVADLHEHRVVELEDAKLRVSHSGIFDHLLHRFARSVVSVVFLQLLEDGLCSANDLAGHAGNACNVNTEGVFGTARLEFSEEYHLVVHLLYGYVEVLDAWEETLHLVEFVVVGCEEGARCCSCVFVDVFNDGPCY